MLNHGGFGHANLLPIMDGGLVIGLGSCPCVATGKTNSNFNRSYYAKELNMLVLINLSDI